MLWAGWCWTWFYYQLAEFDLIFLFYSILTFRSKCCFMLPIYNYDIHRSWLLLKIKNLYRHNLSQVYITGKLFNIVSFIRVIHKASPLSVNPWTKIITLDWIAFSISKSKSLKNRMKIKINAKFSQNQCCINCNYIIFSRIFFN